MTGTNKILGGGGFHHVAIRARDFDASVRFYSDTLGCTTKIAWGEAPSRAIMLDVGDGNYIEIFEHVDTPPAKEEGQILHLCLRCADPDGVIERVRQAGCEVTVEPKDLSIEAYGGVVPVRLAFFKGPDGEIVELFRNDLT